MRQEVEQFWGTGIEYIFVDDGPRQSIREERWEMGHDSEKRRRGLLNGSGGDLQTSAG